MRTAKNTPHEAWTAETTAKIQSILPKARLDWQAVKNAPFAAKDYNFNVDRHDKMKQFMEAESLALEQLKNNLKQDVPIPQLRKSALGIKPHFAGLINVNIWLSSM